MIEVSKPNSINYFYYNRYYDDDNYFYYHYLQHNGNMLFFIPKDSNIFSKKPKLNQVIPGEKIFRFYSVSTAFIVYIRRFFL